MEFHELSAALGQYDDPHAQWGGREMLYDFVCRTKPRMALELGFAHGVSSCCIAAALDANGGGRLVTIDRRSALDLRPRIHDLLAETGLTGLVDIVVAETSYNWELMRLIEKRSVRGRCKPCFHFCFIDGAHQWEIDGCAFFLAEKLLRPGGWMLFDDLDWSFATSPSQKDLPSNLAMPDDERITCHVEKIFDLLVHQHTSFGDAHKHGPWGWARKL